MRQSPQQDAIALALALRLLGMAVDPRQIYHRLGSPALIEEIDILRAARAMGAKAKAHETSVSRLQNTPMPALAFFKDKGWVVIGKVTPSLAIIQGGGDPGPLTLSIAEFSEGWRGRIVLLSKRAALGDTARRFDLTWFWGAISKYRSVLYEVLAASFVIQLFALATPIIFQTVIDKVLVHRGLSTLEVLVAGLALIALFDVVLSGLRTYLFTHTSNRIDVELGSRVFRHLMALPLPYFEARRVGDSVARVRELETIRQFLTSSSITLVLDLLFCAVFIGVMFLYSSILAWIVVATLPLYAILSIAVTPLFRVRLEEKFHHGAINQAFLVESITGAETVKAMAVEPLMQKKWEEQLAAYVGASFRAANLGNIATQATNLLNKLTTVVTLFVGAGLIIKSEMTVGELVAFNMLSSQVSSPVLRLAQVWQDFHQVRISIARLGDILNTPVEYTPGAPPPARALEGAVQFERVQFRYGPGERPALQEVSFTVEPGQVIGIVGPSGSGKSTIAKLIQRLYLGESGRVLVDGADIRALDPAWLRRQIGVVLQENVLFNASVRDNIALADPGMPIDEVVAAAKLAGAHDFICNMREGYDTLVGERGVSLSGGQRQRLAIARALVSDPRILIFDEATSALDYESESIIHRNMRKIVEGRTVFIIAHRLSAVRMADRILTIEDGVVTEDGPHEQLVAANGRYATLLRLQSGAAQEGSLQ
jgi:ATP-binding cassette, subfamily B, bacterial HlyB/CyaB